MIDIIASCFPSNPTCHSRGNIHLARDVEDQATHHRPDLASLIVQALRRFPVIGVRLVGIDRF